MRSTHDRSIELRRLLRESSGAARDFLRDEVIAAKDRALVPLLLDLLNPSKYDVGIVNMAAMALAEMKAQEAVTPIVQSVRHPKQAKARGTLIYALRRLDWSAHVTLLVDLVGDDNFEVREMARLCFDEGAKRLSPQQREIALELLAYRLRTAADAEAKPWIVHTMSRLVAISKRQASLKIAI